MTQNLDFLTKNWREFAGGLSRLNKAEGTPQFLREAFLFLNSFVTVDSCAVFKISPDKVSGAEHLCTFGDLDDDVAAFLADRYVRKGFLNDPIVQTALPKRSKVRHLPRTHYSAAYRSRFFEKADLIDKVTSLHSSRQALFSVNFYRVSANGQFTNHELTDLEQLGPIITQYVLRHVNLSAENMYLDADVLAQRVEALLSDNTQIFAKLSVRERQVCEQLLLGRTEKEIAAALKVSATTIVTYRQRLYAKLNIASKEELFQLAIISFS